MPACQPPIINPPDGMLTVTPPPPPVALIAVPNCPGVETLLAVTCTNPVIVVGGRPPEELILRIVPLSARIPTALEPSATIGPDPVAFTVALPLAALAFSLPATATIPRPPPPWTVMPGPV